MDNAKKYYKWLCGFIQDDQFDIFQYEILLQNLFLTEFYWTNGDDYNRAMDGIGLRRTYEIKNPENCKDGEVIGWLEGKCSVLELMISLSIKIVNEYIGKSQGENVCNLFWEMVDSLDLTGMNNDHFDELYFDDCMRRFLAKTPNPTKKEKILCLFHFDKSDTIPENWSIWDQAMRWISKKMGF